MQKILTRILMLVLVLAMSTTLRGDEDLATEVEDSLRVWQPEQHCRFVIQGNVAEITAVGGEPIFFRRFNQASGDITAEFHMQTRTDSTVVIQWITKQSPRRNDTQRVDVPLTADGQWHSYSAVLPVDGTLLGISVRLTSASGVWLFATGQIQDRSNHPLVCLRATPAGNAGEGAEDRLAKARVTIANTAPVAVTFRVQGTNRKSTLLPSKTVVVQLPTQRVGAVRHTRLTLEPDGFPSVTYSPCFYDDTNVEWIQFIKPKPTTQQALDSRFTPPATPPPWGIEIARDGTAARILKAGKPIAVLAPLAKLSEIGEVCVFEFGAEEKASQTTSQKASLTLNSQHVTLKIILTAEDANSIEVAFTVTPTSSTPAGRITGPRLRLLGQLRSGLLAGIESLASGDVSSSPVDVEPPKHRRCDPNPLWLTMPLAMLASDDAVIAARWEHGALQPHFNAPDEIEDIVAQAWSLSSQKLDTTPVVFTLRISDNNQKSDQIAEAVKWFLASHPIPEPPQFPRDWETQRTLCLATLNRLAGEDGTSWSLTTAPDDAKRPYSDFLSVYWRLSGIIPEVTSLERGGGDIGYEAIYFVSGRAAAWKEEHEKQLQHTLPDLRPDGSFLYRSRFPEVENASSSVGYDVARVAQLMDIVRTTGDRWLFTQVEIALSSLAKTPVPRGGFYRDTTLHTPDLLSAARLCRLFVDAYQFSPKEEYLQTAVRFALHGLPFVYQREIGNAAHYTTIPMLGATGRKEPVWFGTSRPQTGLVYADALWRLAEHDQTIDWRRVARGIVAAVEATQWTEGPLAGCIPSAVEVNGGRATSPGILPIDLAAMRMMCEGLPIGLTVLANQRDRIVSPFPIKWSGNGVEVLGAPAALRFQMLYQGRDILSGIGSGSGRDVFTLE